MYEVKPDKDEGRNSSSIVVADFDNLFTIMDKKIRKEISKEIENLTQ